MPVIVVGRGVIGLLTAVECVLAGISVTLVDRADVADAAAASSDAHRVVRVLHQGDRDRTIAAAHAQRRWDELGAVLGMPLLHRIGALAAMPMTRIPAALDLLAAAGSDIRGEPLSPTDLADRYPHVRFPSGSGAVLEPLAGIVLADRVLAAVTDWLRHQPGVRLVVGRVTGTDAAGTVRLADGDRLTGDRVVVAAGPWARALLPAPAAARLTLYRQSVLRCRACPDAATWADTPAIAALGTAEGAWLAPPFANTPLRLSAASACRPVSTMEGPGTPVGRRAHLVEHFSGLLPGFRAADVVDAEDRYYLADTATGGPVLLAASDREWHFAACGGLSFKFAPLIARALAGRLAGHAPAETGIAAVDHPRPVSG